jgi:hypothetical protein
MFKPASSPPTNVAAIRKVRVITDAMIKVSRTLRPIRSDRIYHMPHGRKDKPRGKSRSRCPMWASRGEGRIGPSEALPYRPDSSRTAAPALQTQLTSRWPISTISTDRSLKSLDFSAPKPNQTGVFQNGKTRVFRAAAPAPPNPLKEGPFSRFLFGSSFAIDYRVPLGSNHAEPPNRSLPFLPSISIRMLSETKIAVSTKSVRQTLFDPPRSAAIVCQLPGSIRPIS